MTDSNAHDAAIARIRAELAPLLKTAEKPAKPHVAPKPLADAAAVAGLADAAIGKFIDHTLLKPESTRAQIEKLCAEAAKHKFASVCVNPDYVPLCVALLKKAKGVGVATVIGFPLGSTTTRTKVAESKEMVKAGATELDMVVNIGRLKDKDYAFVLKDIRGVVAAAGSVPVKVILETGGLTLDEKIAGCVLSVAAGAAFVKTSTGFLFGGATAEDIELMRRVVGPKLGVKASGGIRDNTSARAMLAAGANRLGTSAAIAIIGAGDATKGGY